MGEVEPRLGWERVSGLESGGDVGRGFEGEEVFVSIGIRGW